MAERCASPSSGKEIRRAAGTENTHSLETTCVLLAAGKREAHSLEKKKKNKQTVRVVVMYSVGESVRILKCKYKRKTLAEGKNKMGDYSANKMPKSHRQNKNLSFPWIVCLFISYIVCIGMTLADETKYHVTLPYILKR